MLIGACVLPPAVAGQDAALQGIITSSDTGAPLDGVAIVLNRDGEQAYGALTDRNGFYQIGGIGPGTYTLVARRVGYLEHTESIVFALGEQMTANFSLELNPVSLEAVVVQAGGGATVRDLGRQHVTPAEIRRVPVPAGAGDLASYLQILPGVTTTGDRGGQLFVRGGTSGQNLVLVDGIPMYQPFHILGFFSAFPSDVISSVDFYAGGFGARYSGRSSSVLDVGIRDGDATDSHMRASASPFLISAVAEGPLATGVSWIASARRSLVDETSGTLLGTRQPLTFDDELFKITAAEADGLRCSVLALHTADRGRLDPDADQGYVEWTNLLVGGRCVRQFANVLRLLEVNLSYSSFDNSTFSRGSSKLQSRIWRMQYDAHATSLLGSIPFYFGGRMSAELLKYDLREIFATQKEDDGLFGINAYVETDLPLGSTINVRPGVVVTGTPISSIEPRFRASWEPLGRSSERLQGAVGLYRQNVTGASDIRDVSSVFMAWIRPPDDLALSAIHADLGWQQSFDQGVGWSIEGYYKRLSNVPIPAWNAVAQFTTRLERADGEVYGGDARVEYTSPHFYGLVGYGYSNTTYEVTQPEFEAWFGEPVQRYHPPHDRRHQVNALISFDAGDYTASARWELGTGLPYTRPMGFDEAFDLTVGLPNVAASPGVTRLIVDKPFTGRLPVMHRLDISVERPFDLSFGRLTARIGAINVYDRRNMFYYDLFSGRRVDQLPFAPYFALTLGE